MGKAQGGVMARGEVIASGHRKRVVGAVRESRERDTSTSPDTQKRKITGWTDLHDGDLIHVAVDRDVSGKTVSPWDRPDLGYWMAHPEKFDVLCAAKLDRICRNAEDFFRLIRWSQEHSIALVFIEEGFDLTTPAGTMAAKILAVVAEFEWDSIRGRTLDGQQTAVQQGRWRGGIAPYGYRPVKEVRNGVLGWYLEIDPDTSGILRGIVGRVILGEESISKIAEDLNSRGVLTSADAHRVRQGKEPKGSKWYPANMIQLLRSRALLGEYQTAENDTLRDENTSLPLGGGSAEETVGTRVEQFIKAAGPEGVNSTALFRKFGRKAAEMNDIISELPHVTMTKVQPQGGGRPALVYRYEAPAETAERSNELTDLDLEEELPEILMEEIDQLEEEPAESATPEEETTPVDEAPAFLPFLSDDEWDEIDATQSVTPESETASEPKPVAETPAEPAVSPEAVRAFLSSPAGAEMLQEILKGMMASQVPASVPQEVTAAKAKAPRRSRAKGTAEASFQAPEVAA
ncbi:recombinase family protein [Nonomuraea sp. NPDC003709]|uniref:recombinase family protein n=1 Tax=Nonomuraea sp. NPDC003709 TaxID=3154450 RepID=UPI00339DE335